MYILTFTCIARLTAPRAFYASLQSIVQFRDIVLSHIKHNFSTSLLAGWPSFFYIKHAYRDRYFIFDNLQRILTASSRYRAIHWINIKLEMRGKAQRIARSAP